MSIRLRAAVGVAAGSALSLLVLTIPVSGRAFPAFARKYGMSCSACHVAWPIFNQQGQNFRDNGYQFDLGKDDPVTHEPAYVPIALRTTPAYQYTRMTHQAADGAAGEPGTRSVTTQTGGVPIPPGVDILTGGVVAPNISYLVVVSGFGEDGLATLESAWARLDRVAGTSWLNLRIGKFELDQPASSHRNVTLTTNYAAYSAHPEGTLVGFDLAENQVGVELDGHDARSLTRYSVSVTSANGGEGQSSNAWSAPMVYGHLQRSFEPGSTVVPWVRIGALGAAGWWPTAFDVVTPIGDEGTPEAPEPVPGTGRNHKRFYRAGAELAWMMGHPSTPLLFQVAYLYGREDAGLAGDGSASNSFHGGFVEVDWVPVSVSSYNATPWLVFARYDAVRYDHGVGDFDGGTIGVRRYLALGPRSSAAIHLEGHIDRAKGTSPVAGTSRPLDVETQAVLAGIDFDF